MKELLERQSTLRDVLLWFRIPEFIPQPSVEFIDQDLDEVTKSLLSALFLFEV